MNIWLVISCFVVLLVHLKQHSAAIIAENADSTTSLKHGSSPNSNSNSNSNDSHLGGDGIKYSVVIDAGSTGSRAYIFKIDRNPIDNSKQITTSIGMKVASGLSNLADNLESVVNYFLPILDNAASIIPSSYQGSTDIFILGTAGMRLLETEKQATIWKTLYEGLKDHPSNPFTLEYSSVGTIDGNLEAYYAVLSSNYIAGSIDADLRPTKTSNMIGALDMGGSSSQLIFYRPPSSSGAGLLSPASSSSGASPIRIKSKSEKEKEKEAAKAALSSPPEKVKPEDFWSHSWLDFGNHRIREKVINHLITLSYQNLIRSKIDKTIVDTDIEVNEEGDIIVRESPLPSVQVVHYPCFFKSYDIKYNESVLLRGSGDFHHCSQILNDVLWPDGNCKEETSLPCGIDGITLPPVQGAFFGMSVYFYALDCIRHIGQHVGSFVIDDWPKPRLDVLEHAVQSFCSLDWEAIRDKVYENKHQYTPIDQLPFRCLDAIYQLTLLVRGFGFPRSSNSITLALEVEGREVEWTLGFVLAKFSSN